MKKRIVKDTLPYLVISFLTAAVGNTVFFTSGGRDLFLFVLSLLGSAWFLINLRLYLQRILPPVLQKLAQSKYLQKPLSIVKQLLGKALSSLAQRKNKISAKWASIFPSKSKANRISFFRDEKFVLLPTKANLENPFKKMKWKNLKSNRERIRYIYIAFMKKKIKQGFSMNPAYTPNEVYYRLRENEPELSGELFSLYNEARYNNDENRVTQDHVNSVLNYASKRLGTVRK